MPSARGRFGRRRTGAPGVPNSTNPWDKGANVLLFSIVVSSVIYLVCTNKLLSRERERLAKEIMNAGTGYVVGNSMGLGNVGDEEEDPRIQWDVGLTSTNVELKCEGKTPEVDLAYWKDTRIDREYESPWAEAARHAKAEGNPKYVTFEPDHGGFNNIRMAMETVVVFAKATGRTLVMPPAQKFYLLSKPAVEFADMFPVEIFSEYMDVISTEEFLEKEGMTGRLGKLPPGKKTSGLGKEEVEGYLREVADLVPRWDHMLQALIFGPSPDEPDVPKDEESQKWLSNFLSGKRTPLWYDKGMQKARFIHFRTSRGKAVGDQSPEEYRLFTHFYTFIGFSDPIASAYYRRLVRDVVHFREDLFCIAAGIVAELRKAGGGHPGSWSGWHGEGGGLDGSGGWGGDVLSGFSSELGQRALGRRESGGGLRKAGFSTFHIRRGDFQYARMKPEASVIVKATERIRVKGEVLFIATDEMKKSFFNEFKEDHRIFFLSDFKHLLREVDPSYYLMIDTIVASQGRAFIGTWRSTFTGYITRLRGYYGFPTEFSWYFWDESKKDYEALSLAQESMPRSPFFMREWPNAWENIDDPVEDQYATDPTGEYD